MKKYIVYDKKTGKIVRHGQCIDKVFDCQVTTSAHAVMEGKADDTKHKITNGKVVDKTTGKEVKEI